tara:strand:+ start:2968 stop:3360 length:393 start_codon:yes stop_codon:yes gene_type:complete
MATHIQQWKLTNKDDSLSFGSVEEFFNKSSSAGMSEETINQHINNDSLYVLDKYAVLSADKKSVILVKEFRDEESYNEWKEKSAALPAVDDLMTSEEGTFFDEKPDVESGEKDISIDYSSTPSGVSGDHK